MNVKYIIIGLIFLINPNIEVVDILPDFIGTILIILGINKFADISERGAAAKKALLICTYLNAAKCLSILTFLIISASEMTWMLVFTMCFGLGEAALLCYAFFQLAEGISYTAMLADKPEIFNRTTAFFGLSTAFICVRTIMSIFPELVYLNTDYGTVESVPINWEFVTLMLYALNVLVVTSFGIIWYINSRSFFKIIKNEKDYLDALDKQYMDEVGSNRSLLTYRAFKTASLLILLGVLFIITLRLDGIDLLPDFIGAAMFFVAVLRLKKLYPDICKKVMLSSAIYFLLSLGEWVCWFLFSTYHYTTDGALMSFAAIIETKFFSNPDVYTQYILLTVFSFLKTAGAAFCLVTLIPCIKAIIKEHTGAIAELRSEVTERKTAAIQKNLFILLKTFICGFIISALLDPVSVMLCFTLPIFNFVAAAVSLIYTVYVWLFNLKLTEAIENKYLY